MKKETILITGAGGQIGAVLAQALRRRFGYTQVIATDIRELPDQEGPSEILNILDAKRLHELVQQYKVTQLYHLAAILSAKGELQPKTAWEVNMQGIMNVLIEAKNEKLKVFFPSSIAVFGSQTPSANTPQHTVLEPETVYGISKAASETWCQYFHKRYGVDVRSLRYPGIIGYETLPGGGTTDYAVDIYHQALKHKTYECFLRSDTLLPMMYMPDAIRATLELMETPPEKIKVRTSYNLSGMSFSPAEVAAEIRKHIPGFNMEYKPDFRQQIADTWPNSIDDSTARNDWGWRPEYDLASMTTDMLKHLKERYAEKLYQ
jgi:nucleoside-diphosphate-sugar epimerase